MSQTVRVRDKKTNVVRTITKQAYELTKKKYILLSEEAPKPSLQPEKKAAVDAANEAIAKKAEAPKKEIKETITEGEEAQVEKLEVKRKKPGPKPKSDEV